MAPTLRGLGGEFRSLAADLLLPPALAGASHLPTLLLTGTACQLIAWVLGPARLDQAFPYLRDALIPTTPITRRRSPWRWLEPLWSPGCCWPGAWPPACAAAGWP